MTACKHPDLDVVKSLIPLPQNTRLCRCRECQEYFVVRVADVRAASNGGLTGRVLDFLPSNSCGFLTNNDGGFTRPLPQET